MTWGTLEYRAQLDGLKYCSYDIQLLLITDWLKFTECTYQLGCYDDDYSTHSDTAHHVIHTIRLTGVVATVTQQ